MELEERCTNRGSDISVWICEHKNRPWYHILLNHLQFIKKPPLRFKGESDLADSSQSDFSPSIMRVYIFPLLIAAAAQAHTISMHVFSPFSDSLLTLDDGLHHSTPQISICLLTKTASKRSQPQAVSGAAQHHFAPEIVVLATTNAEPPIADPENVVYSAIRNGVAKESVLGLSHVLRPVVVRTAQLSTSLSFSFPPPGPPSLSFFTMLLLFGRFSHHET